MTAIQVLKSGAIGAWIAVFINVIGDFETAFSVGQAVGLTVAIVLVKLYEQNPSPTTDGGKP